MPYTDMASPDRTNPLTPLEDVKRIMQQVQAKKPFQLEPYFMASPRSSSPISPMTPGLRRDTKLAARKTEPVETYSEHDYEWAARPLKPRRKRNAQHSGRTSLPF